MEMQDKEAQIQNKLATVIELLTSLGCRKSFDNNEEEIDRFLNYMDETIADLKKKKQSPNNKKNKIVTPGHCWLLPLLQMKGFEVSSKGTYSLSMNIVTIKK